MKNEDKILTVLEEIRDNQKIQVKSLHAQLEKYDEYLGKQDAKYDQYLAKSRSLYNAHIRNVLIILVVAISLIFIVL